MGPGLARLQPAVVFMEDLHWVDSSTLEVVNILARKELRVLYSSFAPRVRISNSVEKRAHHTQLVLSPLTASEVRRMIARIAGNKAFEPEIVARLVTRTGGVPLFVEELAQSLLEGGTHPSVSEIPATLQDSLMARLDRLGEAKEVAEVGAVIGSEFSYELISAILPLAEADLQSHLKKLSDADLIYVRGLPPDSTYSFKHALIRDAAYEALLRSRRRQLHQRVVHVLETQHPNVAKTQPEILALHYSSAEDASAAVAAWRRAAERAIARGAFHEAEEYYNRAIVDLMTLPDTLDRAQQEMPLRLGLGHVSVALNGYAAEETLRAYNTARALGDNLGNPSQLLFILMGLFVSALTRAEKGLGRSLADELLRLASKDGGTLAIVWANLAQGMCRYFRGDLRTANEYLSVALSHSSSLRQEIVAQDPGLSAILHESMTSWHLGMADSARKQMDTALEMTGSLKSNYATASAEHCAAVLSALLREPERCRVHVRALSAAVENQDFPFFNASSVIFKGQVLAESGQYHEGASLIRDGISQWIRNGMRVGMGFFLGLLAEVQCRSGEIEESFQTVEDAIASTADEELWQPYLLWVRGNLLLNKADASPLQLVPAGRGNAELWAQAEQSFRDSLAYADRIGSKSVQLRAATSLARILKGKVAERRPGNSWPLVLKLY